MHNRYFKSNLEITKEIESVIVGTKGGQRPRSKNGNAIIKLGFDDKNDYQFLKDWQELTYEQVVTDLQGDEWHVDILQAAKDFQKTK